MRAMLLLVIGPAACAWDATTTAPPDAVACSCESETIATDDGFPTAFGIDGDNVYWSSPWHAFSSPAISSIRKDGRSPSFAPSYGCAVTGMIVTDDSGLYVPCDTSTHGVDYFPKDGSATTTLAANTVVSEVKLDADDDLFWAGDGGIWKKPPGQASVEVVTDDVDSFAIDAMGIYWCGYEPEASPRICV